MRFPSRGILTDALPGPGQHHELWLGFQKTPISARSQAASSGAHNGRVIEAVVFDLDGVLIDSEPVWEQVRRDYVEQNRGHWPVGAQDRLMGMSTPEWARYLREEAGVDRHPDEVAATVVERMADRYAEELPLIPGALEALARLGGRWPLGLASSSPRSLIDTVLTTAGLTDRFAVTVSTEEVAHGKPAPDVYRDAVRGLDLSRSDVWPSKTRPTACWRRSRLAWWR